MKENIKPNIKKHNKKISNLIIEKGDENGKKS